MAEEALPIVRGYQYSLRMAVTGGDNPVFPEGAKLRAQVREYAGAPRLLAELTFDNGGLRRVSNDSVDMVMSEAATRAIGNSSAVVEFSRIDVTPFAYLYIMLRIPVMKDQISAPVVVTVKPALAVALSTPPAFYGGLAGVLQGAGTAFASLSSLAGALLSGSALGSGSGTAALRSIVNAVIAGGAAGAGSAIGALSAQAIAGLSGMAAGVGSGVGALTAQAISGLSGSAAGAGSGVAVLRSIMNAALAGVAAGAGSGVGSLSAAGEPVTSISQIPWTPAMISARDVMEASAPSSMLNAAGTQAGEGEAVAAWNSQIGSNTFAQSTSAARPTVGTSAEASPSGVRPVRFRGASVLVGTAFGSAQSIYSMFLLARIKAADSVSRWMVGQTNKGSSYHMLHNSGTDVGALRSVGLPNIEKDSTERVRLVTANVSGSSNTARKNGDEASVAPAGLGFDAGNAAILGGPVPDGSSSGNGMMDVFAYALVPSSLSRINEQRMEGYLAHRAGLASTLADAHPFKSAPPTVPEGTTSTLDVFFANVSPVTASNYQTYRGGYIEIQPDSYAGGSNTYPDRDETTALWGFPQSLSTDAQATIKAKLFPGGGKGIKFIRLPFNFAYRGRRNIDGTTGLAKNAKARGAAQAADAALANMLANVIPEGGGLIPEWWGYAEHWLTTAAGTTADPYLLWAGGSYGRTVTLDSIRTSDPTQYAAQISALTSALVDDLEWVHQRVAPVRGWGIINEPMYGNARYGSTLFTNQLYSDVLASMEPKVRASSILSTANGVANYPLLHVCSADDLNTYGTAYQNANPDKIDSYTYHRLGEIGADADWIKNNVGNMRGSRLNQALWQNEYEYLSISGSQTPEWRTANNMLRKCHDFVFGRAPYIMPIIHVAKPAAGLSGAVDTEGFALYSARPVAPYEGTPTDATFPIGGIRPVDTNLNSSDFWFDSAEAGMKRLQTYSGLPTGCGFCAAITPSGKRVLFLVNRTASSWSLRVHLGPKLTMKGRRYRFDTNALALGSIQTTALDLVIPAYSGESWKEQ